MANLCICVFLGCSILVSATVYDTVNICSSNKIIGQAVLNSVNLSWPGLQAVQDAASKGLFGKACSELSRAIEQPIAALHSGGSGTGGGGGGRQHLHDVGHCRRHHTLNIRQVALCARIAQHARLHHSLPALALFLCLRTRPPTQPKI